MNLELFIARRLILGKEDKISISAPIIKIAIAAIALGIIMMLVAIGTGVGLKLQKAVLFVPKIHSRVLWPRVLVPITIGVP